MDGPVAADCTQEAAVVAEADGVDGGTGQPPPEFRQLLAFGRLEDSDQSTFLGGGGQVGALDVQGDDVDSGKRLRNRLI